MATVRYLVKDVDRAIAFYTGLLDFELRQQFGPAMAILTYKDLHLWLAGPSASAAKNRFVVEVENLTERVATLRRQGVEFRNDVVEGPGGRQILCEDPSGNAVELFEPR